MTGEVIYRASVTAPVNIAVIKYWGKRNPVLNLPTNSSISVTLSVDDLCTHTTASCSSTFEKRDVLILNNQESSLASPRTRDCLTRLKQLRADLEKNNGDLVRLSSLPLRIVSQNNFPTAAGLASSAAGFAAMVSAVARLYQLSNEVSSKELSSIARLGSGSACRSLYGGYVSWEHGINDDGSDSVAVQVAPESHWPEMRALILIANAGPKHVSSSSGMQTTVATSSLFKTRVEEIVPMRMKLMKEAILGKDFSTFAKLTMSDSNSFHAVCLDTSPPIFYLNEASKAVIRIVDAINNQILDTNNCDAVYTPEPIAAYTFDAGPNAVVYYLKHNQSKVASVFKALLPGLQGWNETVLNASATVNEGVPSLGEHHVSLMMIEPETIRMLKAGISDVILTRVGKCPQESFNHLVD